MSRIKLIITILVFYVFVFFSRTIDASDNSEAKRNFKESCEIAVWSERLSIEKKAIAAKEGLVPGFIGKSISLYDVGYEYGTCLAVIGVLLDVYRCDSPYVMAWPDNDPAKVVINYLTNHEGSKKRLYEDIRDALFEKYKCQGLAK